MRCEFVRSLIEDALEGASSPMEVGAALPPEARSHLEACASCRADVHEALALARALGPTGVDASPPAALLVDVMARVRETPPGDALLDLPRLLDADFAEPMPPPASNRPLLAAAVLLFAALAPWGEQAWSAWLPPLRDALATLTVWIELDPSSFVPGPAAATSGAPALAAALVVLLAASAASWWLSADREAVTT